MANPNIVNVATINGGNLGFNLSNTLTATLLTVDAEKLLINYNRNSPSHQCLPSVTTPTVDVLRECLCCSQPDEGLSFKAEMSLSKVWRLCR